MSPIKSFSWSSWLCLFVLRYIFLHFVSTSHVVPTPLGSQNIDCSAQYPPPRPAPRHAAPQKEEKKEIPRFIYLPVLIVFLLLVIEPLNKFAPVSGNQQLSKLSVPVGFLRDRRLHFWFFMTASALGSKNVSAPICLFEDKNIH